MDTLILNDSCSIAGLMKVSAEKVRCDIIALIEKGLIELWADFMNI